jgi:glyoxylase-like metal-dependent hydrolase (beta-lactamase superfamily II)/ferredoxin
MASTKRRLPANVPGPFFVDSTCIDCDACRWIAPETFEEHGEHSRVHRQPESDEQTAAALRALVACPTASIGGPKGAGVEAAAASFPYPLDDGIGRVCHCGFHAESSFGAASYFVRRPEERGGNLLVDSPRWNEGLARRIEERGGARWMLLTHRDDVADHARYAERLGLSRVIHAADADALGGPAEVELEGDEPSEPAPGLLAIPTPGHTRGSACFLVDGALFSGDHLAWSPSRGQLVAFRDVCWFDWRVQTRSMERLLAHDFEWVLPGHGRQARFPAERMRRELERCVAWMRARG